MRGKSAIVKYQWTLFFFFFFFWVGKRGYWWLWYFIFCPFWCLLSSYRSTSTLYLYIYTYIYLCLCTLEFSMYIVDPTCVALTPIMPFLTHALFYFSCVYVCVFCFVLFLHTLIGGVLLLFIPSCSIIPLLLPFLDFSIIEREKVSCGSCFCCWLLWTPECG